MVKKTDEEIEGKVSGKEDDEIVVVEVDGEGKPISNEEDKQQAAKGKEGPGDDDDGGEDEDGEDARLAGNDDDRTEENRKNRKNRNEARRIAKQRDKLEINFLRRQNEMLEKRVGDIETRSVKTEVVTAEGQISQLKNQLSVAEDVIAKAVKAGNGEDVVQAMKMRDDIRDDITQLERNKGSAQQRVASPPSHGVDQAVVHNANVFFSKVPWYSTEVGTDEDSDAIRDIEAGMVSQGSDPRTAEHWQRLEKRVRKTFASRFENDESGAEDDSRQSVTEKVNGAKSNGGPRLPASGQSRGGSPRNIFQISPERKAALVDAGVWDDPVLRKRYVKRYAAYDAEKSQRHGSN